VANLGWAAGDHIRFKVARDANNASDNLVGDYGLTMFKIIIPRA